MTTSSRLVSAERKTPCTPRSRATSGASCLAQAVVVVVLLGDEVVGVHDDQYQLRPVDHLVLEDDGCAGARRQGLGERHRLRHHTADPELNLLASRHRSRVPGCPGSPPGRSFDTNMSSTTRSGSTRGGVGVAVGSGVDVAGTGVDVPAGGDRRRRRRRLTRGQRGRRPRRLGLLRPEAESPPAFPRGARRRTASPSPLGA